MIWKILLYALTGYVMLCSIYFIFQRKLLYLPSKIQLSEEHAIDEGFSIGLRLKIFKDLLVKENRLTQRELS